MLYAKDPALIFNHHDPYSPHTIITREFPRGKTVLDVGCNTGYVGHYLIRRKNCVCDGIDYNQNFLNQAKDGGYRHTFRINLYNPHFKINAQYDLALFIDILEHLPRPDFVLRKIARENLKKNGQAIICRPNIARWKFRLPHLSGKFSYQKSGIMSRDHLRFFTRESAIALIRESGLSVNKILPTGIGARIKILPTFLSFQFIFFCQKK